MAKNKAKAPTKAPAKPKAPPVNEGHAFEPLEGAHAAVAGPGEATLARTTVFAAVPPPDRSKVKPDVKVRSQGPDEGHTDQDRTPQQRGEPEFGNSAAVGNRPDLEAEQKRLALAETVEE